MVPWFLTIALTMPINYNNNHVNSSEFLKPENTKSKCLCSLIFKFGSRRQGFVSLSSSHPTFKYIPNAMEVTEGQILLLKLTINQLIQPLQGETDETHCLREMTTDIPTEILHHQGVSCQDWGTQQIQSGFCWVPSTGLEKEFQLKLNKWHQILKTLHVKLQVQTYTHDLRWKKWRNKRRQEIWNKLLIREQIQFSLKSVLGSLMLKEPT